MSSSAPSDSPSSSTSTPQPSSLAQAAERIRDAAKWLIASFAAVGAILVAGLQLTGIGKLSNDPPEYRLTWALQSFAVVGEWGGVMLPA
jgi:hypothetical protein